MSTLSLADEADFIALRSQLTLPTKPTSSGDEVNSIFEGSLYVFQTLVAHGVMVAYYVGTVAKHFESLQFVDC